MIELEVLLLVMIFPCEVVNLINPKVLYIMNLISPKVIYISDAADFEENGHIRKGNIWSWLTSIVEHFQPFLLVRSFSLGCWRWLEMYDIVVLAVPSGLDEDARSCSPQLANFFLPFKDSNASRRGSKQLGMHGV